MTRLDHDANVAPWLELAQDAGLVVRQADVHADTTLDVSDLERQLGPRTRVVAFPWASNAVGTTVDARAVCDLAHQAGALAWIDAVQYAPHEPIDVRAVGADVLLCSAYKFCGPHLGIAYGRREVLESWRPYKARPAPMQPVGHRFETGTLPYELLGGLVAAFAYLDSLGGRRLVGWERQLGERLLAGLPPGARLYGLPTMAGRVPTFLVNFPGVPSAALSAALADRGFGVWSGGSYYAPGLHERIAWGEALRIGLAHYNTLDEVDRFNEALASLVAEHAASAAAARASGPVIVAGIRRRRGARPTRAWSGSLVSVAAADRRFERNRRARRRAVVRDRGPRPAGRRAGWRGATGGTATPACGCRRAPGTGSRRPGWRRVCAGRGRAAAPGRRRAPGRAAVRAARLRGRADRRPPVPGPARPRPRLRGGDPVRRRDPARPGARAQPPLRRAGAGARAARAWPARRAAPGPSRWLAGHPAAPAAGPAALPGEHRAGTLVVLGVFHPGGSPAQKAPG